MEVGQQLLAEPEPTREVKSWGEGATWLGVDPGTKRVSVALAGRESMRCVTRSFPRADGARRLAFIYAETFELVRSLEPQPGFAFVEQPSGKSPNPNLVYAVGVIAAAVYAGLHNLAMSRGAPAPVVEMIPSATWKKVACGRGDLWKPKASAERPEFESYAVAAWARENGFAVSSWDEADAAGIAVAARRTVRFV
jgi:hypothetical protein